MAKQPRHLYGKVVAITGGARGIGRATARALVQEGAKVAIGDIDEDLARRSASELGGGTVAFHLDVTDPGSFERFLDGAESELGGPLEVLINNAGIMRLGPLVDEDDATTIRQVDINLHGVITGTKLALRRMRPRGSGHLVNVASTAGKYGAAGGATYSATKHAVVGLTEAARGENLDVDIEFSIVMPGVVDTDLASGLPETRAVEKVRPDDVGAAIVDALRYPRVDVFVPKSIGPITAAVGALPRRAREAVVRLLKADKVLWDIDRQGRGSYEARAAQSEPRVEEAEAAS